jgi:hypothetical protein
VKSLNRTVIARTTGMSGNLMSSRFSPSDNPDSDLTVPRYNTVCYYQRSRLYYQKADLSNRVYYIANFDAIIFYGLAHVKLDRIYPDDDFRIYR